MASISGAGGYAGGTTQPLGLAGISVIDGVEHEFHAGGDAEFFEDSKKIFLDGVFAGTFTGTAVVLALGRFDRFKGFDVALKALARVPGAYLWLAGEGEEEAALRALAAISASPGARAFSAGAATALPSSPTPPSPSCPRASSPSVS